MKQNNLIAGRGRLAETIFSPVQLVARGQLIGDGEGSSAQLPRERERERSLAETQENQCTSSGWSGECKVKSEK